MDELVGRNIEGIEILRDSGGDSFSVIKTSKIRSGLVDGKKMTKCDEYFKVDDKVSRITDSEYKSLKVEDREFFGE